MIVNESTEFVKISDNNSPPQTGNITDTSTYYQALANAGNFDLS